MAGEPDWVPAGVDTRRANIARLYDYLLGGSHNFLADQDVGRALAAVEPEVRAIARANRAFGRRAVRFLGSAGISQFRRPRPNRQRCRLENPRNARQATAAMGPTTIRVRTGSRFPTSRSRREIPVRPVNGERPMP